MEEVETGLWALWYRHIPLGYYEQTTDKGFEVKGLDFQRDLLYRQAKEKCKAFPFVFRTSISR